VSETRKLAAILVSDVVGYSRLTGADEDRILARLRTLRSDLIDPTIAVHHGRIVKRTGDGSIVEFRSVVDAVNLAIEVQRAMVERNAEVAADKRIEFRIGIHLGDVVEENDGDLMGDGVNIAARLQGVATPGGICISDDAYRQVRGRLDLKVSDLGPVPLKNIAEPMRAYSLEFGAPREARSPPPADQAKSAPKRRSSFASLAAAATLLLLVAAGGWTLLGGRGTKPAQAAHLSMVVLPFANLSGDPAQDYFADGITENLTTDLSRLSGAFVIARNTAFTYKGKNVDAKEIGKELRVRYVLEGSVQRDPGRMRINVQLIDAETGNHLWAERFDKPLTDLFDMQDEIVARLANQLGTALIAAEARRAERAPKPDSLDLYFQGMAWFNKGPAPEYLSQARDFFERALALDPSNIDALVGTARVDALMAAAYMTDDRAARFAAAEATLTKVLSLAPNDAWAHFWMGVVKDQTNRTAEGIAEVQRALALDPNLAAAHGEMGNAKIFTGQAEETEAQENEALRLSPRDNFAFVWMLLAGAAKVHLGANEEAVEWLRRSIEVNRNLPMAHFFLAAALGNLGKLDEARAETQAGLALNPNFSVHGFRVGAESNNPIFLTQRERLLEGLRKAGVPEQ
jgi:TolB-like protein/class 3 adenylate cyclase/Flp pilus assembly protein TadD